MVKYTITTESIMFEHELQMQAHIGEEIEVQPAGWDDCVALIVKEIIHRVSTNVLLICVHSPTDGLSRGELAAFNTAMKTTRRMI